ncbi:hypothetical protein ABGB14_15285 [Nonomuraea sp. B10E15]|uniref:hypothetical protein n=1 Tax=Nonomuraea sp. B10E15 TaxID=3153560 RepID=UPI00325EAE60
MPLGLGAAQPLARRRHVEPYAGFLSSPVCVISRVSFAALLTAKPVVKSPSGIDADLAWKQGPSIGPPVITRRIGPGSTPSRGRREGPLAGG